MTTHSGADAPRGLVCAGDGFEMRREYRVPGLPEPISHYTDAVQANGMLFVSGCVPVDGDGRLIGGDDVVAQARQVFVNIGTVLSAAGAEFADVVKVTVFLLDIDDRPLVNTVRQEVFGDDAAGEHAGRGQPPRRAGGAARGRSGGAAWTDER